MKSLQVPLSQGKLIEWKLLVLVGECLLFECSPLAGETN